MPRIIIHVASGTVQSVRSDTEELDVEVLDEDLDKTEEEQAAYDELEIEFRSLEFEV